MKAAFINSKGFGGNNATGLLLSPQQTLTMLSKKYGEKTIHDYLKRNEPIKEKAQANDKKACEGKEEITFNFGENVIEDEDVNLTIDTMKLPEFENAIDLVMDNPYQDYLQEQK